jgi:uncharacterized phage protein gp47/JayE
MITFVSKSFTKITDSILSQITKGIANERHEYTINRTKYRLANSAVIDVVKIDGTVNGGPYVFQKDLDYRRNGYNVEWTQEGQKPDDHTPFFVNYRLDAPQGITDINPGSVIRNIVESVALEIDFLYAQMNQVYNSGFIDTATGKSLDLIVSMLGITRKEAGFATGEVTFGRNNEPGELDVAYEAHVFNGEERFGLKSISVKGLKKIEGISEGRPTVFMLGEDCEISENEIRWLEGDRKPDTGSVFYVDYTAYEEFIIPIDTRVSNYSRRLENLKIFRTTREAALTRNQEGKWEVEVPVVALTPGKEGNIFAGSINVMPKPVIGIEYVINKKDILNGTDIENDSDLRERAKQALEVAGKATLTSLKTAVQGVEGVTGEVKVVDQPDNVPGIVQIIASGGDEEEIERVINETRSAGIMVELKRPKIVSLDIKLTILVVEGMDVDNVKKQVDKLVRNYFGTLNIDDDVILNHIIKSVLSIEGVRDVRDVTINGIKGNIEMKNDEKCELRTLEISIGD